VVGVGFFLGIEGFQYFVFFLIRYDFYILQWDMGIVGYGVDDFSEMRSGSPDGFQLKYCRVIFDVYIYVFIVFGDDEGDVE